MPARSGSPTPCHSALSATPDLLLSGAIFLDLTFTGLDRPPAPGTEVWAAGLAAGPGGMANIAVAASRLGERAALAAAFGDDPAGTLCWAQLADVEAVDLRWSRRCPGWSTPVTVALSQGDDRSLVTYGTPPPLTGDELLADGPPARAVAVDLGEVPQPWIERMASGGALVFADVGWDPTDRWSPAVLEQLAPCYAFLPNAGEAMRYTKTDSAAAALKCLSDRVPVAVVTLGASGAIAIDATTGESAAVGPLTVDTHDTTGAGDAFGAGFIHGTLAGWPLDQRLRFANLVAALSTERAGGAGAPSWPQIAAWWQRIDAGGDIELAREYGFVAELLAARRNDSNHEMKGTPQHGTHP